MRRTELDYHLDDLRAAVLDTGALVADAIARASEALLRGDHALAACVIDGDDAIDRAALRVDEQGARLIALQQPALGDLRAVLAALAIAQDLERMGDHAEGIARLTLRAPQALDAPVCAGLRALTTLARVQTQDALDAYRAGDASHARRVWQGDAAVDRLHAGLVAMVMAAMGRAVDADARTTGTYALWIAHALERIADRATNICERVVYIATGDRRLASAVA